MDKHLEQIAANWPQPFEHHNRASDLEGKIAIKDSPHSVLRDRHQPVDPELRAERKAALQQHIHENMSEIDIDEMGKWLSMFNNPDTQPTTEFFESVEELGVGTYYEALIKGLKTLAAIDEENEHAYERAMRAVTQ